jgi:hypothetical protein
MAEIGQAEVRHVKPVARKQTVAAFGRLDKTSGMKENR